MNKSTFEWLKMDEKYSKTSKAELLPKRVLFENKGGRMGF